MILVIFSKIIIATKLKFSGYTKLLTGYRMIYHTSSSHTENILHKFLHCSVRSGVIYTNIYTVVYIFVYSLIFNLYYPERILIRSKNCTHVEEILHWKRHCLCKLHKFLHCGVHSSVIFCVNFCINFCVIFCVILCKFLCHIFVNSMLLWMWNYNIRVRLLLSEWRSQ